MLHNANPGNKARSGCIVWLISFAILGFLIFMGMKWGLNWSEEMFEENENDKIIEHNKE